MKFWSIVFLCLHISIFISCNNYIEPEEQKEPEEQEKSYNASILWEREIYSAGNNHAIPLIDDRYLYFSSLLIPGGGSNIVKIDMENGKVIWESERITEGFDQNPHKIGMYIFQPVSSGFIYVFSDINGDLAATIRLGDIDASLFYISVYNYELAVVSGPYLFWGNAPRSSEYSRGLMRFDSTKIDFSINSDEVQIIPPDLFWTNPLRPSISTNILSEDGIIYFLTGSYLSDDPERVSLLVALDAETGIVIWEQKVSYSNGWDYYSLVLNNDKLFIIEKNLACFNKFTGALVYKIPELTYRPYNTKFSLTTLHNNFFYYFCHPETLICINADTSEQVWHTLLKRDILDDDYLYSYSSPRVYNDMLFILYHSGLLLYNSNDGEFIGIDKLFKGNKNSFTTTYKDAFVFTGSAKTRDSIYLTAVEFKF